MARLSAYQDCYANLAMTRDDAGVLEIRFHTNGGPFIWSAEASADFAEAFRVIGSDPETKVVILTGTRQYFCIESDEESFVDLLSADGWSIAYREGRELINGLTGIDIPVISAVNGPAHVHSELLSMRRSDSRRGVRLVSGSWAFPIRRRAGGRHTCALDGAHRACTRQAPPARETDPHCSRGLETRRCRRGVALCSADAACANDRSRLGSAPHPHIALHQDHLEPAL